MNDTKDITDLAEQFRVTDKRVTGILYTLAGAMLSGAVDDLYDVTLEFAEEQRAALIKHQALNQSERK